MIDLCASIALATGLAAVLGAYAMACVTSRRILVEPRIEQEAALPIVGRVPMHAVYRVLIRIAHAVVVLGISANAVSILALALAACAAVAFGLGHFGVGAAIACAAALADGIDGLVARASGNVTRLGRILDTTIDRYVDALLLGGIAVHVRARPGLLVLALAALTGSFMVSYASSVERELGIDGRTGPMRRAARLALLLTAAFLSPIAAHLARAPRAGLAPVLFAVAIIAIFGNVSAVHRLLRAARAPSTTA